jgi:hypothetical protein
VDADGNMLWDKILGGSKSDNVVYWKTGIEINNQYLIPFTSQSNDGDILNPLGGADGWIVTLGTACNPLLASENQSDLLSNEVAIPKHRPHELADGEIENNLSNEVAIFPNPVTNTITISFSLEQSQKVSLNIFNVSGRLVITLADASFEEGDHEIIWNAADINAGINFLQFQSAGNLQTSKLIVTK